MMNKYYKHVTRHPECTGALPWSLASLILVVAMCLTPCHAQTNTLDTAISDVAQDDLPRILALKDAAIEQADQQYVEKVDVVEQSYEQSLIKAQMLWSGKVEQAKAAAVTDLKDLSSSLAAAGQLTEMVKVLKAIYALTPQDQEAAKALAATGVDLETISPEPDYFARRDGVQPSRIVIWNTHNSRFNTSGTQQCNLVLFHGRRAVWRSDKINLPWERNNDTFAVVNVPAIRFDIVRVEISKWRGYSGGLSEIEVWQGGKNVALHKPTRASASVDTRATSAKATDGVTTSLGYKDGYWLLPDNQAGWIEISLAKPLYQKLFRIRVSARKPWQTVLEVAPGDMIDISASGKWRAAPQIVAGPDGGLGSGEDKWGRYSDRFYLQGRLDGEVFKIGSRFTLRVPRAGHLELGMNEANVDWFRNNSGFLDVALSLRKRPPLPPPHSMPESITQEDADRGVGAVR
jgi:hypothetical protein